MMGATFRGLFTDELVTASDLARRSSQVLDSALQGPVTITRNSESFALLSRKDAAKLFQSIEVLETVVALIGSFPRLNANQLPDASVGWLSYLGPEDREEFQRQLFEATSSPRMSDGWDSVEQLVHEWHETARLVQSGALSNLGEPSEDIEIPDPSDTVGGFEGGSGV